MAAKLCPTDSMLPRISAALSALLVCMLVAGGVSAQQAGTAPNMAPALAPAAAPPAAVPSGPQGTPEPTPTPGFCTGQATGCTDILSSYACQMQPGCKVLSALGDGGDGFARRCGVVEKGVKINCTDTIGYDFCLQVPGCEWNVVGVRYGPGYAKAPMAPTVQVQSNKTKIIILVVGCTLTAIATGAVLWWVAHAKWFKKDTNMDVNLKAVEMSRPGALVTDWDL